ncbi:hypothetical protein IV55_GL000434 [Furfurilactobacillus siliginis]|uniref:UDP-N-acetylglucosamine kinase n=1 Tax=Furfurilactobacillus siliginis TaxID=348151 RepID=A0A0R2KZB5_9LACO|nr:hypothetical protein IV55_GL000434 [Furfurilactobacillus siliginis]GEK28466.1 hypothetical protein LSI01_07770 [Furfurilactobacillus siliginis]
MKKNTTTGNRDDGALRYDPLNYVAKFKDELIASIFKYAQQNADEKVAIFTAGTPGSGKTEGVTSSFGDVAGTFAKLDPDDFRSFFPGYDGENAAEF